MTSLANHFSPPPVVGSRELGRNLAIGTLWNIGSFAGVLKALRATLIPLFPPCSHTPGPAGLSNPVSACYVSLMEAAMLYTFRKRIDETEWHFSPQCRNWPTSAFLNLSETSLDQLHEPFCLRCAVHDARAKGRRMAAFFRVVTNAPYCLYPPCDFS